MSENIETPEVEQEQVPPVEEKPKATRGRKPAEPKVEVEEFVPAIRRIVLYVTAQETVRPAIITRDNGDGTFQLTVFNSGEHGAIHEPKAQYMPYDDELGFVPGTFH